MGSNTKIEWCDHTFNPWVGCTKVGPGCDHCYAENINSRFKGGNWGAGAPRRRTSEANWKAVKSWNWKAEKEGVRYRVFCASMGDWLDNEVPVEWLVDLLDLIRQTPNLDWLLLTKRVGNWRSRLEAALDYAEDCNSVDNPEELFQWIENWLLRFPPKNVWVGATVVNQQEADRDILKLLSIPANIRFLSVEPMLGPVSLFGWINWVICGGESGPGARPINPVWVRSLRDQCQRAGVPFFFKQWGEWGPVSRPIVGVDGVKLHDFMDGTVVRRDGKKKAGRILDGKEWNEFPLIEGGEK